MMVHAYNPDPLKGRGRRITSLKPAQAKVNETPSQKQKKKSWSCSLSTRPWVQFPVKKKKERKEEVKKSLLRDYILTLPMGRLTCLL
jgi:hypothetical protein